MARQSSDKIPLPILRNMDSINTLVEEGKVFGVTNVTIGTGIAGQTGTTYTSISPTFSFRNVGSKVMVPLLCKLYQTGTVADIRVNVHVATLETGQFTSGTALTAYNRNQWSSNAATVLPYHTATLPQDSTGNRKLRHTAALFQTVTAANADVDGFPDPGFTMVRPGGQLDIYTLGSTSAPTWFFDIQWAELEY